jgi:hypothetical protein
MDISRTKIYLDIFILEIIHIDPRGVLHSTGNPNEPSSGNGQVVLWCGLVGTTEVREVLWCVL